MKYKFFLFILLGVVLTLGLNASARLQAYLDISSVRALIKNWEKVGWVPDDKELNRAFELAYRALNSDNSSAEYRYVAASLHTWHQRELRLWPKLSKAENDKIIQNLKASLIRRPTWYDAWILLTIVKYRANQLDEEFEYALSKSIETGRYETSVHHGISIVGLRQWSNLSGETKKAIKEVMLISLRNYHVNKFVIGQMFETDWMAEIKNELETDESLKELAETYAQRRGLAF